MMLLVDVVFLYVLMFCVVTKAMN